MAIHSIDPVLPVVRIYISLINGRYVPKPWTCDVPYGRYQIIWLIDNANGTVTFDTQPITFNGSHPFKRVGLMTPWFATCVDNNRNQSGQDIDYEYAVNLRAVHVPIRCPPIRERKAHGGKFRAGPYIRNKPT